MTVGISQSTYRPPEISDEDLCYLVKERRKRLTYRPHVARRLKRVVVVIFAIEIFIVCALIEFGPALWRWL